MAAHKIISKLPRGMALKVRLSSGIEAHADNASKSGSITVVLSVEEFCLTTQAGLIRKESKSNR
jgi:hypothetical protein